MGEPSYSILYIINALDTGGAEVGMCRLLDGLDEDQFEVTVLSLNGSSSSFVERIPSSASIIDIRNSSVRDVRTVLTAVRDADVIVGSLFHSVLLARMFGIINSGGIVATWQHSVEFKSKVRKAIIGITNRFSDVILADSEVVAEMYRRRFNIGTDSVKVVPIAGLQLDEFNSKPHRDKDRIVVGSIGRLEPEKNYRTVLRIAEAVSGENIEFWIAGVGSLSSMLEDRISTKGLDNIELVGEIEDVPSFLSSVDIYIQPSYREGLCITVLEAMAAELPVVASPVGGIKHNVTDGQNGYLHKPDDVTGYSDSIRELATDAEKRQQFGRCGRTIVKQNYTQKELTTKFKEGTGIY